MITYSFRGLNDLDEIIKTISDIGLNLDIGHFVAANADLIALIQKRHARINAVV